MTRRYKLTVEYDGRPFVGWQRQDNGPSVQAALERAFHAFCGEEVAVQGAGRTDSGVHASGQVAHVDLVRDTSAHEIANAVNWHLKPDPVSVLSAELVDDEFHARFSARQRHYAYRIINRRAPLTFDAGLAWQVPQPLDAAAMHEAAQHLVGTHDFTTFRHVNCQAKSPVKTIDHLSVERDGDDLWLTASARSFLHHQIRSFVGTLSLVGRGKWTAADVVAALEARDRRRVGLNAPPDGLYFTGVDY